MPETINQVTVEVLPAVNPAQMELPAVAPVAQDGAVLAQWTVGKSEKVKTAHTERAYMAAPAKVRMADSYMKTRTAVLNGRYIGLTRDFTAALSKAQLLAFSAHLSARMQATSNLPIKADGAALATLGNVDKKLFRMVAEFMAAPRATIKKVEQPKELAKSAQWMTTLAAEWLAANPA